MFLHNHRSGSTIAAINQTVELIRMGQSVTIVENNNKFSNRVIEILKTEYHKKDSDIQISKDELKRVRICLK